MRHEEDDFGGYAEQTSLVVGLGSRFIENDKHLLDLSAGVGYRSLEDSDSGDTEGIVFVKEYSTSWVDAGHVSETMEINGDHGYINDTYYVRNE